ncbi:LLM class flavin-dependent oxidoreductase [Rhodococcus sp. TAF43]|uniref:LLM class flavin-dependent oxidoreductase n=1 Tax=Rhodococcus sp. TAF43 TaxID=3237483 RepID=UPI003F9C75B7
MSVKIFWYLTQADGDYPWTPGGLFPVDGQRQIELAKTIDDGGFDGALVATWPNDPFVSATWAASHTSRMKFLVAVYANMIPARLLAEKALTFDAFSGGRLMINSVNGRDNILTKYDMNVEHDRRYELGEQYWADFRRYYREGTESNFPNTPLRIDPLADREVPLWGTGDSPAGLENSGKVLDAYLAMLRETSFIEDKFDGARKAAAAAGREFTDFGALSGVIVRPSRAETRRSSASDRCSRRPASTRSATSWTRRCAGARAANRTCALSPRGTPSGRAGSTPSSPARSPNPTTCTSATACTRVSPRGHRWTSLRPGRPLCTTWARLTRSPATSGPCVSAPG